MTDAVWLAAIAAIAPTLASLAGVFLVITNARKADVKQNEIIEKTDQVHSLTNSRLTELTQALATANERIAQMQKTIGALIERNNPDPSLRDKAKVKI